MRGEKFLRTVETQGEDVILVHGLARTKYSMGVVRRFLARRGYRVLNCQYPSTKFPIAVLSERYLGEFIRRHGAPARTMHFVTHSMGGLVVRFYLEKQRPAQLGRVVMLAPPNQGSEVTDWHKTRLAYRWWFGPAGQQLGTDAASLPAQLGPVTFELGVIAGDRSINPFNSRRIPGADDGKVAVERTKAPGMQDFLLVHACHTFIMRDAQVLTQIAHFLQTGQFGRDS